MRDAVGVASDVASGVAAGAEERAADAVAFLYPGHSAEDDFPRAAGLLRAAGVRVRLPVLHTDIGTDAHRVDALLEMGAAARLSAALAAPAAAGAGALVWACTSGSFVRGWEGAREQVRALGAAAGGRPASSTSFAFVHAARAVGVRRVAVAATYPDDVAGLFAEFLGAAGLKVTGVRSAGIITAAEVGTWGPREVLRLARAGDRADAEAVLVPDTALHTVDCLPELERELGKPVLTAVQVTVWEGLRLLGRHDGTPAPALGTLFTR
ncbi:maleate cis-trans isomerase family protein [Streptomyces aidingensis]|uniref:Maleate cis-trans isomerase n=1 Tax=Streptomyces aidingensis TaxID=910347 RepID=A0A1I1RNA2_9ACTN|nr:decarboxylase [Streptomyces aidingensis]SFD33768.1 Maleate cis-trans isomerase [Streptomyces aidingensis]